tara:strand:- start:6515 stop:8431 length:1917 start_codon:yes stop_codon:yes gene_type:complete
MATDKEPQAVQRKGDKEEQKEKVRGMFSRSTDEQKAKVRENEEEFGAKVGTEEYGRALVDKSLPEHAAARRAGEALEGGKQPSPESPKMEEPVLDIKEDTDRPPSPRFPTEEQVQERLAERRAAKSPEAEAPIRDWQDPEVTKYLARQGEKSLGWDASPDERDPEVTKYLARQGAKATGWDASPEAEAPVSEDRLGESPVERYPGESEDLKRSQAIDKALAADSAREVDAFSDEAFEDVPEDFTPRDTVKTLRAESPTQEMAREVGQPGPIGGGGRIKQVEEISADDPRARLGESTVGILEGMDPEAEDSLPASKEEAADRALAKTGSGMDWNKESSWQGRGGYNFTYRPPATKDGQPSILVEAPIGREGSSMKEGTKAVITPTEENSKIWSAIINERLGGEVGEYGKRWSGGPSKSSDPKDPPKDKWVTNADGTKDYYDEDGMLMVDGSKTPPRKDRDEEIRIAEEEAATHEENARRLREESAQYGREAEAIEAELSAAAPRQDYGGGDPTRDEIIDAVSELSPSAKAAKQRYNLRQAEQRVQQAESAVQQAEANLAEATQRTETTGDATAQTEAEELLFREKNKLAYEINLRRTLAQSMRGEPVALLNPGGVDLEKAGEYTAPERAPGQSAPWGPK